MEIPAGRWSSLFANNDLSGTRQTPLGWTGAAFSRTVNLCLGYLFGENIGIFGSVAVSLASPFPSTLSSALRESHCAPLSYGIRLTGSEASLSSSAKLHPEIKLTFPPFPSFFFPPCHVPLSPPASTPRWNGD